MSQTPETLAPPESPLRLDVRTGDAQSEIIVLDSRGRFVARGLGPFGSFELVPGFTASRYSPGRKPTRSR